jgi:hypothetical protein
VLEFSDLEDAGRRGFTLTGSGTARVVTPRRYRPGRVFTAEVGGVTQRLMATARGRLRIDVPLGPSNTLQQYAVPDTDTSQFVTTTVEIKR